MDSNSFLDIYVLLNMTSKEYFISFFLNLRHIFFVKHAYTHEIIINKHIGTNNKHLTSLYVGIYTHTCVCIYVCA